MGLVSDRSDKFGPNIGSLSHIVGVHKLKILAQLDLSFLKYCAASHAPIL